MPFPPAIPPFSPEVEGTRSPESIQDCAIGEEADEPVSHSDFVEEGLLRFHNVSVWHPEELHETRIQGEALVALKNQPLVRPALSEVYGGRVVLRGEPGSGNGLGGGAEKDFENGRKGMKSYFPSHLHLGQEYRL